MSYPHNTRTLDPAACAACVEREAGDEYRHGRVDNFYRRYHLRAVGVDESAPVSLRLAAWETLTQPSYPIGAKREADREATALRSLLTAATVAVVRVP